MRKRFSIIILAACLILAGLAQTVKAEPASPKLIQSLLYAEQGMQYTLQTDGGQTGLNWSSSNTAVATVSNGVVRAGSAGYAVITVSDASDPSLSATCQVVVKPKQVTGLTLVKTKSDKLSLTWKEVKGCDGYHVYYCEKGTGQYSLATETTRPKAVIKALSSETGYDIKVASFINTPLGKIDGTLSLKERLFTAPNAPGKTKITKVTKGKFSFYRGQKIRFFNVEWKKVKGANVYQVYCTNGKKKPQLVATVKKPKAALYASLGYNYKIYVVPCRKVHGITTMGKKSKAVVVDIGR